MKIVCEYRGTRIAFSMPDDARALQIIRAAKRKIGLADHRCERIYHSAAIELRPLKMNHRCIIRVEGGTAELREKAREHRASANGADLAAALSLLLGEVISTAAGLNATTPCTREHCARILNRINA